MSNEATSIHNLDQLEERQLVELAKKDPLALSALYRSHYHAIYGYVYRRLGNSHDTHDVVAEVFVSMVRYLPRYRWTGAPFRSWLLRVATTQINRWLRKRRFWSLWSSLDNPSTQVQMEVHDTSQETHEAVRAALLTIPIAFQTVLSLYYFEDLSIDEIAEIVRCRSGTVKSRLSRGREILRKKLNQHEEKVNHEQRTIGTIAKKLEV